MTKASKGLCATVTPSDKPRRKLAMQYGRCKGFLSVAESLIWNAATQTALRSAIVGRPPELSACDQHCP